MGVEISLTFVDEAASSGDASAQALLAPKAQTEGAAGLDLVAAKPLSIAPGRFAKVETGICVAIPFGFEGQVRPRSGLAARHGVTVLNAPGTIDADYRGEIGVVLINHGTEPFAVERGDRVAQLVIASVAKVRLNVVTALDETARGAGGFGSTGRL